MRPDEPDEPDDLALLDAWVERLRAAYAVHPAYRGGPGALAHHRRRTAGVLCRARLEGTVATRWIAGALTAVVTAHPEPDSWFGAPTRPIAINCDPDDPGALDWVVEQVAALDPGPDADFAIFAHERALVDRLMAAIPGLGIDSIVLLGETEAALDALVADRDPPPLEAFGLTAGPVETADEADAVTALTRDAFTCEPGWCWFGARPRNLARLRAGLLVGAGGRDPDDLTEVVRRDGRVVGCVQLDVERDSALWGTLSGVGLVLHPDERGRGLLASLYRRAFERLRAAGVPRFKGGTSQPPVMRLGRLMGRTLHAVHLRVGATFPRGHFAEWL